MENANGAKNPSRLAKLAGWLYLAIIACGIFSEAVVRMSLVDYTDAATTMQNVTTHLPLFRAGFAADLFMLLSDVAVAGLLYVLFKTVSLLSSLLAAAFRLAHAAVLGSNLLNYYGSALALTGPGMHDASAELRQTQALLMLDLHRHGYDLALVFFAISLFFLCYLIIKSSMLPRIIGYGLLAAGTVYSSEVQPGLCCPVCWKRSSQFI